MATETLTTTQAAARCGLTRRTFLNYVKKKERALGVDIFIKAGDNRGHRHMITPALIRQYLPEFMETPIDRASERFSERFEYLVANLDHRIGQHPEFEAIYRGLGALGRELQIALTCLEVEAKHRATVSGVLSRLEKVATTTDPEVIRATRSETKRIAAKAMARYRGEPQEEAEQKTAVRIRGKVKRKPAPRRPKPGRGAGMY